MTVEQAFDILLTKNERAFGQLLTGVSCTETPDRREGTTRMAAVAQGPRHRAAAPHDDLSLTVRRQPRRSARSLEPSPSRRGPLAVPGTPSASERRERLQCWGPHGQGRRPPGAWRRSPPSPGCGSERAPCARWERRDRRGLPGSTAVAGGFRYVAEPDTSVDRHSPRAVRQPPPARR